MRYWVLLGLLLVPWTAGAAPAGAKWYADPSCTVPLTGQIAIGGIAGGNNRRTAYYCPADGADSNDILVFGTVAHAVWNGDVNTPPGSVTLHVYADCPSTANSTGCVDPFSDSSTSPYQIMDPGTPASCSVTLPPGRWRFHPSGSATNGRLEIRGN